MPEGPEIRRAADEIGAVLNGRIAQKVTFAFEALQPYADQFQGERVTAVTSRGKAMLIFFANDLTIYSHNQLYGKWFVQDGHDYPDTSRQLRLAIHTQTHSALLYSASDIAVLRPPDLETHPYLNKLGPDALDSSVSVDQVRERLENGRFQKRQFSALLLDQAFLAGLGNYLRSEILFVSGIFPTRRPIDCTAEKRSRLAAAALDLTRQSYHTAGVTNNLKLAEKLRQDGVAWRDYRFWVFNRDGRACYTCGTPIVKATIGGRRCYYCPNCQA